MNIIEKIAKIKLSYWALAFILVAPLFFSVLLGNSVHASIERRSIGEPLGMCHAGYSTSSEEYAIMDDLGVEWMRVDFSWSRIEPAEGEFDFEYWDAYMDAAVTHDKKVMAILDYETPWLPNQTGRYIRRENVPYFLNYVNETVRRYKDNVAAFEIWNEPNMYDFWVGSREDFLYLFNHTAELIHSIDPEIVIVGGAVAGNDPGFIEAMFEYGCMKYVDAISFHPYSTNVQQIRMDILELRQLLAKYNYQGELWITEIGNPTEGTYGHTVTEDELSERVVKTLAIAMAEGINVIIWYTLFDASDAAKEIDPMNTELYFGLLYHNQTWKKGAYGFQIFGQHAQNSMYSPDLIQIRTPLMANTLETHLFVKPTGERLLVLWSTLGTGFSDSINLHIEFSNSTVVSEININTGEHTTLADTALRLDTQPRVFLYSADESEAHVSIQIETPFLLWGYIIGLPILVGVIVLKYKRIN